MSDFRERIIAIDAIVRESIISLADYEPGLPIYTFDPPSVHPGWLRSLRNAWRRKYGKAT